MKSECFGQVVRETWAYLPDPGSTRFMTGLPEGKDGKKIMSTLSTRAPHPLTSHARINHCDHVLSKRELSPPRRLSSHHFRAFLPHQYSSGSRQPGLSLMRRSHFVEQFVPGTQCMAEATPLRLKRFAITDYYRLHSKVFNCSLASSMATTHET